jgi:hypothetical protein
MSGWTVAMISVLCTTLLFQLYSLILSDYQFFISLGPGGTPQTPAGYLRITLLRLIAHTKKGVLTPPKPFLTSPFRAYFRSSSELPQRRDVRPKVAGLAPHRQLNQKGSAADVDSLMDAMRQLVNKNTGSVITGKSCFEKHSLAIFLSPSPAAKIINDPTQIAKNPGDIVRNATCGTPPEVAHMHGSDGSLHLTLHPEDAATVINRGWGERHPLAGRTVPRGFMMVYAPRGEEELEIVMNIIRAAAWWVGSVELD